MTEISEQDYIQALVEIHRGLPRCGPGGDQATRRALTVLGDLPAKPRVLDLGAGPGKQTLVLAAELGAPVTAVDLFPDFLEVLTAEARQRGLEHLVRPLAADMSTLKYGPESWDLVWSEGAIYTIGFDHGLEMIRPWLSPGGKVAVSEATWLKTGAPPEVLAFWEANYPAMRDLEANLAACRQAGYRVLGHFTLDPADWWRGYWDPMTPRLEELEAREGKPPALTRALADTRLERRLFRRFHQYYGYEFYLLEAA